MPIQTARQARDRRRTRRSYGYIRRLRSGRYQASYVGPDGHRYNAPSTFDGKGDADAWLSAQHTDIARDEWHKPAPVREIPTFAAYAEAWLTIRKLKPRTRSEYRKTYRSHLKDTFGRLNLDEITPTRVRVWHADLTKQTGPTATTHAYSLLRTILNTAVDDEVIPANPCRVRGAGNSKRAKTPRPATIAELATIVEEVRDEYRAAVLVAAWCALRFGELAELRRKDVHLDPDRCDDQPRGGVLRIRRGVTNVEGEDIIGEPKSEAGVRDVNVPPHLVPILAEHLRRHTQVGAEGLLFPAPSGKHLRSDGALHRDFRAAREAAGRPDLTVHDLRHTGAVLAAATGATLAELMARLGHSTPGAAMRYQSAAAERDKAIAEALSKLHVAEVVQLHDAAHS